MPMSAAEISRMLFGVSNGRGFVCRCPVPGHGRGHGDKNPSLSVADSPDGKLLVRCFAGCGGRDVLAELRRRGLVDGPAKGLRRKFDRPPYAPPKREAEPEPDERAIELWRQAIPATGTLAERYLRNRGIAIPIPASLRFMPHVDYLPRIGFPALIAAVQRPDRKIIAVQLTFLDPSGEGKAKVANPRKTLGKLGTGAIRLGLAGETLGLAEGTESALSAMQLSGVPVWATLGAQRLRRVSIPVNVRHLEIFGDRDATGRRELEKALSRYCLTLNAKGHLPPDGVGDWNDFLRDIPLVCESLNLSGGASCSI
jgi:putative DNA primase/helicase